MSTATAMRAKGVGRADRLGIGPVGSDVRPVESGPDPFIGTDTAEFIKRHRFQPESRPSPHANRSAAEAART